MSPGGECRRQGLFDISEESGAVHGIVENHGRRHALEPERADKGRGFPMTMWHGLPGSAGGARNVWLSRSTPLSRQ